MAEIRQESTKVRYVLMLNFFLFGTSVTLFGSALPRVLSDFKWQYTWAAFILAGGSIGYFLTTLVSGLIITRFGSKRILLIGLILQALGLGLFGIHKNLVLNLVFYSLIGIGHGCIEVASNFSISMIEKDGKGSLMSFIHGFFSLGAIVSPFIMGLLLKNGISWEVNFRVVAGLSVAGLLLTGITPFFSADSHLASAAAGKKVNTPAAGTTFDTPAAGTTFDTPAAGTTFDTPAAGEQKPPLKSIMFYLASLSLLIYVGIEIGISNWIAEYFFSLFIISEDLSAYTVSVFWIGLLLGRLFFPLFPKSKNPGFFIPFFAIATALGVLGIILNAGIVSGFVLIFLIGAGCSVIYPLVMSALGWYFDRGRGVAMGVASTGGGIGSLLFTLLIGAIGEWFDLKTGFFILLGASGILILCAVFISILCRKRIREMNVGQGKEL